MQRRFDAFAAFFHRVIGQAHHVEVVHVGRADIDFNFDGIRIDAIDGGANGFEEHGLAAGTYVEYILIVYDTLRILRTSVRVVTKSGEIISAPAGRHSFTTRVGPRIVMLFVRFSILRNEAC